MQQVTYGVDVWAEGGRVFLWGEEELTPEEARALAEALRRAAKEAEEGEGEAF